MNVLEAINTRRSVRSYTPEAVDRSTLEQLIHAAIQAPSSSNAQAWSFGVIQGAAALRGYSDRAKAFMLSRITPGSPMEKYRERFADPNVNIFHNAPALIVVYVREGATSRPLEDCALAAQNMMLAAHEMGLGSCYIGMSLLFLNDAETKRELGVDQAYLAVSPIIIGHPSGETPPVPRNEPAMLFWK